MEMQLKQDQAAQTQAAVRKSRPVSVSGFFFFFFSFFSDEHTFSVVVVFYCCGFVCFLF